MNEIIKCPCCMRSLSIEIHDGKINVRFSEETKSDDNEEFMEHLNFEFG